MPGSMPSDAAEPAHLLHLAAAARRGRRGRTGPSASWRRASRPLRCSMVSAAFSTRLTTSPMPRMRPAMRSGWKSSSASSFSPTPMQLDRQPVTARIDSAAPPRASPSTRVSTMPVTPTRSSKLCATLTASWPVMASTTSSVSVGCGGLAHRRHLGHQLLVDVEAAGGVEQHHVIAFEPAGLRARAGRSRPAARPGRSAGSRRSAWRPSTASCSCAAGPARVERGHQHLLALARLEAQGDLGGGGGLARALQPDHQDRHRRRRVEIDRRGRSAPPSVSTRWSWTILTTIWPGVTLLQHALADGLLAHRGDEILAPPAARRRPRAARRGPRAAPRRHRPRSARRAASAGRRHRRAVASAISNMVSPATLPPKHKRARARHSRTGGARQGRRLTSVLSGRKVGPGQGSSQGHGSVLPLTRKAPKGASPPSPRRGEGV